MPGLRRFFRSYGCRTMEDRDGPGRGGPLDGRVDGRDPTGTCKGASEGGFVVDLWRWDEDEGCWLMTGNSASIVDTREAAEALARARLQRLEDG